MALPLEEVRIMVTTWNVGNQEPQEFAALVVPKIKCAVDIMVFGLQESTFTPKTPVISNLGFIFHHIGLLLGDDWRPVHTRFLGEMQLGIFCRAPLVGYFSDIQSRVERTGIASVGANKGGISIRLNFGPTKFTFVSSHLAAHEGKSEREMRLTIVQMTHSDTWLTYA